MRATPWQAHDARQRRKVLHLTMQTASLANRLRRRLWQEHNFGANPAPSSAIVWKSTRSLIQEPPPDTSPENPFTSCTSVSTARLRSALGQFRLLRPTFQSVLKEAEANSRTSQHPTCPIQCYLVMKGLCCTREPFPFLGNVAKGNPLLCTLPSTHLVEQANGHLQERSKHRRRGADRCRSARHNTAIRGVEPIRGSSIRAQRSSGATARSTQKDFPQTHKTVCPG